MPYLSSITLRTGVIAFVVHDAAVTSCASGRTVSWLIPNTMFGSGVFPGAVSSTRATPGESRC
jgi:hypothetical protein